MIIQIPIRERIEDYAVGVRERWGFRGWVGATSRVVEVDPLSGKGGLVTSWEGSSGANWEGHNFGAGVAFGEEWFVVGVPSYVVVAVVVKVDVALVWPPQ